MDAKTDSEVDTANEKVEDTNVSDCSQAKEIARDFQMYCSLLEYTIYMNSS